MVLDLFAIGSSSLVTRNGVDAASQIVVVIGRVQSVGLPLFSWLLLKRKTEQLGRETGFAGRALVHCAVLHPRVHRRCTLQNAVHPTARRHFCTSLGDVAEQSFTKKNALE